MAADDATDRTPDDASAPPPADDPQNAEERARRCAEVMYRADVASQRLGISIVEIAPGRAVATMTVRDDMVNGHGICHGGFVFALADTAFAFACNSYGRVAVAAGADITFVQPAVAGETLTAEALERVRYGRSGLYDVTVRGTDGRCIAEFRGRSRLMDRELLDG